MPDQRSTQPVAGVPRSYIRRRSARHPHVEVAMRIFMIMLIAVSVAACGAESVTAAATAAALKKQEAEQGKKTIDQVRQKLQGATDRMRDSTRETAKAAEIN